MLSVVSVCFPGRERVAELAEVDELRDLRLAHDQLRAVLDRLVVVRKPPGERVARVIRPLDDVEQFALDEIHDAHSYSSDRRRPPIMLLDVAAEPRATAVRPAPTSPLDEASASQTVSFSMRVERRRHFTTRALHVQRQERIDRTVRAARLLQLGDQAARLRHVEHRQRRSAVGAGRGLGRHRWPRRSWNTRRSGRWLATR